MSLIPGHAPLRFETGIADPAPPLSFDAVPRAPGMPAEPVAAGTAWIVATRDGVAVSRCTLATRADLHGAPGMSGMIGHYASVSSDVGGALLGEAVTRLEAAGACRVLGPMNGGTWWRYRAVLPAEPGDAILDPSPFTSEPMSGPFDSRHFEAAGFTVAARYESRLDDLGRDPPDARDVADRVAAAGFSLRPLDLSRFDDELDVLFTLSLGAFADNPYYAPIERAAFHALYEPFRSRVDPGFVWIALDRSETPCGYLFAFGDPLTVRNGRPARMISKTVAVLPRARGQGLANHMLDRLRWTARQQGAREIVHALMHASNASLRMSERTGGRVCRRYALYQRTPAGP